MATALAVGFFAPAFAVGCLAPAASGCCASTQSATTAPIPSRIAARIFIFSSISPAGLCRLHFARRLPPAISGRLTRRLDVALALERLAVPAARGRRRPRRWTGETPSASPPESRSGARGRRAGETRADPCCRTRRPDDGRGRESRRLRIRIRVVGRVRKRTAARPEPGAAHLVGVRLARDAVGQVRNAARVLRRAAPREARDREIRRAPEVVNRAALSDEPRAEVREDAVRLRERAKVAVRVFGVVRAVNLVAFEGDRILDLVGRRVDAARGRRADRARP